MNTTAAESPWSPFSGTAGALVPTGSIPAHPAASAVSSTTSLRHLSQIPGSHGLSGQEEMVHITCDSVPSQRGPWVLERRGLAAVPRPALRLPPALGRTWGRLPSASGVLRAGGSDWPRGPAQKEGKPLPSRSRLLLPDLLSSPASLLRVLLRVVCSAHWQG